MSNKGITYFRLKSQYDGDYTKNCALDGYEVDSNFYTLEGRDIKSLEVDNDEIVVTLYNGDTLSSGSINDGVTKDLSFSFNATKGILYITRNGETQEIEGFSTVYNTGKEVATDNTIVGNGTTAKPISISSTHKTGVYKPVKRFIDMTNKEKLPEQYELKPGDRYITLEGISEHGYLYNYAGIKEIAKDLAAAHSQWRIPTKDDWDGMLNAIEPNQSDRNHASVSSKYLGKYAGKFLKSKHMWLAENPAMDTDTCINYSDDDSDCTCCESSDGTVDANVVYDPAVYPNKGVDKYGFAIVPSGYADDGINYAYFQERAWLWTIDVNSTTGNVYTKRFEYNKSSVYQGVVSTGSYLSLRLVKDYNGDNFNEREEILGQMYSTVMLPSEKVGNAIWTSVNISLKNKAYNAIKPNDGMGLTTRKRYFINEWDGREWHINEMKEGESVVIINAPNDNRDVEYRIINGELTNTSVTIYDEVVSTITEKLNEVETALEEEVTRATAAEEALQTAITEEVERATEKETEIETEINSLNTTIESVNTTLTDFITETNEAIETINTNIENETEAREATDSELDTKITTVADNLSTLNTNVLEISSTLTTAVENLSANDESLQSQITSNDEDIAALQAADETLQSNIDTVSETVSNNYSELLNSSSDISTALEEEITRATEAETALQTAIDDEAETRSTKDEEIEGKLLTEDGTEFDSKSGILTLKSEDGTNDITVQFSFNFGTI